MFDIYNEKMYSVTYDNTISASLDIRSTPDHVYAYYRPRDGGGKGNGFGSHLNGNGRGTGYPGFATGNGKSQDWRAHNHTYISWGLMSLRLWVHFGV